MFPLLGAAWELFGFFKFSASSPSLIGHFLEQIDGGGQSLVSRSLLCSLMAGFCVFGLLLPLSPAASRPDWRSRPWAGMFLLCGLVSVGLSPRFFLSIREWETWALLVCLTFLLRRCRASQYSWLSLVAVYVLVFVVFLHALWIVVPFSSERLGGIFHHSNILSTFCLILLPLLGWRASIGGKEGWLASFLAGALLALQFWSGSLTGACVLTFALVYLIGVSASLSARVGLAFLGSTLPLLFNYFGGVWVVWGYPLLFLSLLLAMLARWRARLSLNSIVLFGLSLLLALGCFTVLSPKGRHQGLVQNRGNSGAARLNFYRAGFLMWAEKPIFGQGPSAFAREYPRFQGDVSYYSKFVHCLPLEIGSEWGALAFLFLLLAMGAACSRKCSEKDAVIRWSTGLFLGHSLTGVQSQFPYLLLLLAIAWGFEGERPRDSQDGRETTYQGLGRILLVVPLLTVTILNSWSVAAAFDQTVALELYKRRGSSALNTVDALFRSSVELAPGRGQAWLQWGMLSLQHGEPEEAYWKAEAAVSTDSHWAAARKLKLEARPTRSSQAQVNEALALDPINYPALYRMKARLRHEAGQTQDALKLLVDRGQAYDPRILSELADFRVDDLEEQLGEYWLLAAVLAEHSGQYEEAERFFRRALKVAGRRTSRVRRLLSYSQRTELVVGPLVTDLLRQVAEQIPAKRLPASVKSSPK